MTLRRLLGVELPVIQAPMAGVQGSTLAIAVSNAGGLGSLPCAMLSADAMAAELAALRAGTSKPFNVNFFCHAAPTPDERREAAWRAQLGTAYMLCPEATTSHIHRASLASDAARHTALTNLFTGRPARGIVNRVIRELGPMNTSVPAFPLAASAIAPLRAKAEARGSGDFSPLWSGQNASGCREVPAALLTRELAGAAR
mgnify:CR=1 FL=1